MLFLINPLFLISFCQRQVELHAVLRTEVIVWYRLGSPLVNILFTTKLLSLGPLFLRYRLSLDLVTIIIPCSLGNCYCTFGFLYHCQKKFLVVQPIYTHRKIIKAPLLHQSLGPVSFFLSLWLSLSRSYHLLQTARSCSIKGPQQLLTGRVMSVSLWLHGLQQDKLPCPSLSPWVFSVLCPLSQ